MQAAHLKISPFQDGFPVPLKLNPLIYVSDKASNR